MLKRFLYIVFSGALALFVWSLWRRPIHVDDAWIGEYVYWFQKLGYVKSEGMRGFFGAENKLFVYHKLFVAEGALVTSLFGFNVYVLKSVSLLALIISFVPLTLIYQRFSQNKNSNVLLWILYLSFFHTMNLAFTFRPEIQLVALGLFGFYCLDRYLEGHGSKFLLYSGLLGAVGIASHLNGMVYVGAGVFLLWLDRKWKDGLLYGCLGSLGVIFYLTFDVRSLDELKNFALQFRNWRDVSTASYGWFGVLLRPITEQQRFLHSPPEIIYTLLLLVVLVPARKYIWERARRLCQYSLLVSFLLAEIAHGANTNYLMYAFPFFIVLAVMALESYKIESKAWKWAAGAMSIFVAGQWIYSYQTLKHKEFLNIEYEKVAEALPKDSQVLAPGVFVLQGLGHQKVQILVAYRDKVETGAITQTANGLFREARAYGNDFVVLDRSNRDYFNVSKTEYPDYSLWEHQPSPNLFIYKRNNLN